jgi:hypothetical protein
MKEAIKMLPTMAHHSDGVKGSNIRHIPTSAFVLSTKPAKEEEYQGAVYTTVEVTFSSYDEEEVMSASVTFILSNTSFALKPVEP